MGSMRGGNGRPKPKRPAAKPAKAPAVPKGTNQNTRKLLLKLERDELLGRRRRR